MQTLGQCKIPQTSICQFVTLFSLLKDSTRALISVYMYLLQWQWKVDSRTQWQNSQIHISISVCEKPVIWGLTITKYILLKEILHMSIWISPFSVTANELNSHIAASFPLPSSRSSSLSGSKSDFYIKGKDMVKCTEDGQRFFRTLKCQSFLKVSARSSTQRVLRRSGYQANPSSLIV